MPGLVLWARYSGFLVLYPLGVASELTVVWLALPRLRARGHYTVTMPNAANFAFSPDALFAITAFAYVFGLPMVRTRLHRVQPHRRALPPLAAGADRACRPRSCMATC